MNASSLQACTRFLFFLLRCFQSILYLPGLQNKLHSEKGRNSIIRNSLKNVI